MSGTCLKIIITAEALQRAIENERAAFQAASQIIDEARQASNDLPTISNKNPTMLLNEKRKGPAFSGDYTNTKLLLFY